MYDCMPQQGKQNHCILYRKTGRHNFIASSDQIKRNFEDVDHCFVVRDDEHMVCLRTCFHETMKFPKLWECVSGIVAHADGRVHGRKNAQ